MLVVILTLDEQAKYLAKLDPDNFDEDEIIIAAILPSGGKLAARLKTILDDIADFKSTLVGIGIEKNSTKMEAEFSFDLEICSNKPVILLFIIITVMFLFSFVV